MGAIGDGESDDTEIDGVLIAPSDPSSWKCKGTNCNNWITFQHFDGLIIQGTGSLHGQGQKWWQMGCIQNKVGFAILDSKNVHISGLTSVDSQKWHISIERSSFVHASKLNMKAPKDSPSTDGIRIEHSTNVTIASLIIKTGCIGIGDGSKYININRIYCGLGHGISIGSLGKNGRNETVEYVTGGHGYARHIRFERLSFNRVIRPIIIDQYSCPPHQHCNNHSTAVEISNILYNDLRGTTNSEVAVELSCNRSFHIAMYPWFALGHITPYVHMANKLAERGHKIAFFLPPKTQLKVEAFNLHPHLITFIPIIVPHVEGLPLGAETTNDVPFPLHPLIMTAMDLTEPHIEAYLRELKPYFVFYDFTCWLPALTRRLGIKSVVYCIISSATIGYFLSPARKILEKGMIGSYFLEPLEGFPSSTIKFRAHEAQALAAVTTMDYGSGLSFVECQLMSLMIAILLVSRHAGKSKGLIVNILGANLENQSFSQVQ
ncbi:hypothetical protein J1N35_018649 [Gossypium stocksii]|uniref:Uncharacterized protein n=1 Tax=Gossypium stocksii TaxID=47602 RepID=A0A9D3VQR5_9ROSI|nr:hypothetical protein J1N35_018649 [Gossypium stocksii]